MKRLILIAIVAAGILPVAASARVRVGVFAGPVFAPYGWYGWYGPYYGGYPFGSYDRVPNAGKVKVDTRVKDAPVFIDGGYAGTVAELKTMTLRPGNHTIEVREPGRNEFRENIHVVAGKTMVLHPDS